MAKPFDFDCVPELTGVLRPRMDRPMKDQARLPLAIKAECERLNPT